MDYEALRAQYRPGHVRVLLVAESPPDPRDAEARFFYAPILSRHDNLFRGVARAVYGDDVNLQDKSAVLRRLQSDGYWLLDACDRPVNGLKPGARRQAVRDGIPQLVRRCKETAPQVGIVVCSTPVYRLVSPALKAAGLRVLHDEPLPFPLGNVRARFITGFRRAVSDADSETK